jgi:hypothetical protein
MPWIGSAPNQQYQRTDGVRSGNDVCQQEQSAGIGILATNIDAQLTDFATALTACLKRDGGTTVSGNLAMNGNKITRLANGVSSSDAATVAQVSALAFAPSGVKMLFYASTAPTGWTQDTTIGDSTIRVVAGAAGGTTGGTLGFTSVFTSRPVSGTIGGTALTVAQMPSHSHGVNDPGHGHAIPTGAGGFVGSGSGGVDYPTGGYSGSANTGITIVANGSGGTHAHTFTGTAIDMSVKYANMILCTKN